MKPWAWMLVALVGVAPVAVQADHDIDWDDWYDGDVQVELAAARGEGATYAPGEPVRLDFEVDEDAYVLVYGIDTDGYVHVLFPRWWEDDGWVPRDERLRLEAPDLAWPPDTWGSSGIVYIEAVASPLPFDFAELGLVVEGGVCRWYDGGRPFRIAGDPFLAFNDIHRLLFPDWEQAVFAVDYTYFYVGAPVVAPRYLGYYHERVYLPPPHSGFALSVRFGWNWEFGSGYRRPVYVRYYVPGRHVVHHHVRQHAVYPGCDSRTVVERRTAYASGSPGSWTGRRHRAARQVRALVRRETPPAGSGARGRLADKLADKAGSLSVPARHARAESEERIERAERAVKPEKVAQGESAGKRAAERVLARKRGPEKRSGER